VDNLNSDEDRSANLSALSSAESARKKIRFNCFSFQKRTCIYAVTIIIWNFVLWLFKKCCPPRWI